MALCSRCGQQTEADEEFCFACGGGYTPDAYSVSARSGTAARASDSPADSYGTPEQSRWFPEADPSEFRSQLRAADPGLRHSAPGHSAPVPTAAARDRQLRYTQSVADAPGLAGAARRYQPDGEYEPGRGNEASRGSEPDRRYPGEPGQSRPFAHGPPA